MCHGTRMPTRITFTSYTLIDRICTNKSNFKYSGITLSYINDDFPVFVVCDTPVPSDDNREEMVSKNSLSNKQNLLKGLTQLTGLVSLL